MTPPSHWGVRPRDSIEAECGRRGTAAVVAGCIRLVEGDTADPALIMALGGPAAGRFLGEPATGRFPGEPATGRFPGEPATGRFPGEPATGRFPGEPAGDRFPDETVADRLPAGTARGDSYWLRVWGLRGLLWVWDDSAAPATIAALHDESWRVREMAAKTIAKHQVGDALPTLADMRGDPVERVRRATDRAIRILTGAQA
ncbi:HEAT repeat domain-containing protein [Actinoplanes subglobosus]|uniref:HEAT repeat domain-containing protein n=1 Tax=Actinoplanes subglobosus TaxID=1547892 RepID=A0ABV8J200_9ACTN